MVFILTASLIGKDGIEKENETLDVEETYKGIEKQFNKWNSYKKLQAHFGGCFKGDYFKLVIEDIEDNIHKFNLVTEIGK